jgi:hypothetical protein
MSILTQYVKSQYVENVLKLLHLSVRVDLCFIDIVSWNLFRHSERDKKSSAIKIKIKIKLLAGNKYIDLKVPFNNILIKLAL